MSTLKSIFVSTLFINFGGKRFFNTPIALKKAASECNSIYPKFCSPVAQTLSFTVKRNVYIVSFISRLFFSGSPITVFRGIISTVINPIKFMFVGGFFSHIKEKLFKRAPFVTYTNPSPSVVRIVGSVFVSTPASHRSPRCIFRTSIVYAAVTMFQVNFLSPFFSITPTALSATVSQVSESYNSGITTITLTQPQSLIISYMRNTDSCELTKSFVGDISCHDDESFVVCIRQCTKNKKEMQIV